MEEILHHLRQLPGNSETLWIMGGDKPYTNWCRISSSTSEIHLRSSPGATSVDDWTSPNGYWDAPCSIGDAQKDTPFFFTTWGHHGPSISTLPDLSMKNVFNFFVQAAFAICPCSRNLCLCVPGFSRNLRWIRRRGKPEKDWLVFDATQHQ